LIFLVLSSTRWRTPLLHVPLIWPLPPSIAIKLNKLCHRSLEVLRGRDRTSSFIYKQQGLLTLREHQNSPAVFGGVRVDHLFSFLCCPFMCLCVLSSVLWCSLQFSHKKNDVRFVIPRQLFVGGMMSYLRYLCLIAYCGVQHVIGKEGKFRMNLFASTAPWIAPVVIFSFAKSVYGTYWVKSYNLL
jgi:hypothetical protein